MRKRWLHVEGYSEGDEAASLVEFVEHGICLSNVLEKSKGMGKVGDGEGGQ